VTLVTPDMEGTDGAGARERILRTAYELFCHHGLAAIGVERIISEAGVHRTSLYKHFPSKEDLVLAVLERRDQVWTRGWLAGIASSGAGPAEGLLAVFDAFDEWFHRKDFEGCLFINSLLEARDTGTPVGAAAAESLATIRGLLRERAAALGAPDPAALAARLQALLAGAIVQASAGLLDAARLARPVAEGLIAEAAGG
jgi:AcrR family transcriptional regulator